MATKFTELLVRLLDIVFDLIYLFKVGTNNVKSSYIYILTHKDPSFQI